MRKLLFAAASLAALALVVRAWWPAPAGDASPGRSSPDGREKVALLVGISDYPAGSGLPRLHGAANDVALVRRTLESRFGFDPADILTLVDAEATRDAIVAAFERWLIRGADEDTQVVFWFSGHGSYVPDLAAAGRGEPDGLDSTLVAWDSRTDGRAGAFDLSDDALAALVAACPSRFKTIVTDACHSGSVLRGDRPPARFAPPGSEGAVAGYWPAELPVLDDDDPRRADAGGDRVHIAAALDHQEAAEYAPPVALEDLPGATHFGALTWFVNAALLRARPGTTYRQIGAEARASLAGVSSQTLSIEGQLDRAVFGDRFAAPVAGFAARPMPGGGIRIEAGELMAVGVGARLEVCDVAGGEVLGTAAVTRADAVSSRAEWAGSPPASPPPALVCRLDAAAHRAPRLRIRVDDAELRRWLADLGGGVDVVAGGDAAHEHVVEIAADDGGDRLVLRTLEGHRLFERRLGPRGVAAAELLPEVGPEFRAAIASELRHQALWRLADPERRGLPLAHAGFVAPTPAELDGAAWPMTAARVEPRGGGVGAFGCIADSTYAEQAAREAGTLAVLEVETAARVAITILSVSEARTAAEPHIDVLWPEAGARQEVFVAGKLRVPVWVAATASWRLARPVRERYLVVATEQVADFRPLLDPTRSGVVGSDLPPVLRAACAGGTLRGAEPVPVAQHAGRRWGVAVIDLCVERSR